MTEEETNNKKSEIALREERVLEFWKENKIFEKTLDKTNGKKEFIFYEGPPTANGKPGIHHLEARAFKDVIPRYKTMQGFHVRRKGGWDTHGLPVELQVEKKLGLSSKKAIEEYGIAKFNQECKESVWEYLEFWSKFTERMGYWVDRENPYVTYHNDYIESVWNIIQKINEQKLLYKDYKVVPWCPRCGTALSSHELAQGYEDITDLSVTVRFELSDESKTFLLAWTTTPWTLPGNTALAVDKKLDYVKLKRSQTEESRLRPGAKVYDDIYYVVSKKFFESDFILLNGNDINLPIRDRVYVRPEYIVEQDNLFKVVDEFKGEKLIGKTYKPIFDYFIDTPLENKKNIWKIWHADFIKDDTGTGIAHQAPAFGVDDMELAKKNNIPVIKHVNVDGSFVLEVKDFIGMKVKKQDDHTSTDIEIVKWLAHNHKLFAKGKITHNYPHCWRCKTALIYYARDSWYIKMSDPKIKNKMIEENKSINWEPAHIRDGRFGEWLREIKDWAISRERYWGTPLPVWICEDCKKIDVIGSIADLKSKTKKSGNKYFVMRHGEAIDNAKHIDDPKGDPNNHLTDIGKKEVVATSAKLKNQNIDLIFCSPFIRTRETAEILRQELGLGKEQLVFDDRLHEYNEANKHFVAKRMGDFIYDIENKFQNKNIVIVSHGGPIWVLQSIAFGISHAVFTEKEMLNTGEVESLDFVPLPHDENHELDLHRPYIDEVKLVCAHSASSGQACGGNLVRTKEVMDVWLDSGTMPFSQDHYPFENKEWVDGVGLPADFISEAIDQTRGWFYTLHAIGVLMGRGKVFKNVICLGHLLDAKGKKMSKSLGNIIDPWEMIEKYGVDSLRLWMYSINQPGESKNFDEKTVLELNRQVFGLLYNVLAFYELYRDSNLENNDRPNSENILDKWILTKLDELIELATKNLDNYKLLEPTRAIRDFIGDLSTWYLRRSRERIKDGDREAKQTLYFVLKTLAKLMAPFAPFTADDIWLKLKNKDDAESIHLVNWPKKQFKLFSFGKSKILEKMETVRDVVTKGLELRQKAGIKIRQPLLSFTFESIELDEYHDIIKDELNVKEIKNGELALDTNITGELKEEGDYRELVRALQDMRKKMGLTPSDIVSLVFETSEAGKALIQKFEADMKKTVLVSGIEFQNNAGEEIKIDELVFKVEIKK